MKQEYGIYKRQFERTLPATPTGIHFAIKFFGSSAEFVGAVDGLNNKAKVTTKKAYGFKRFDVIKIALYQTVVNLLDPEATHKFFGRTLF